MRRSSTPLSLVDTVLDVLTMAHVLLYILERRGRAAVSSLDAPLKTRMAIRLSRQRQFV
jgi:hypothetical protein